MPAEGLPWLERAEILTFGEISRIVEVLASLGVSHVRLTGGEPLVRRQLSELVSGLAAIDGISDLSLTTNGYLLEHQAEELVAAGVQRFNVSIDSLQRDRFYEITRRDALPQVLRGLEHLSNLDRSLKIKVNAVALRGFTEDEIPAFVELARTTSFEVRFIEFMPLDADHRWNQDQVLTGAELYTLIDAIHPLEPLQREPNATARVYRFADGVGLIGLINPVSEPFCGDCNRIRITADGGLRTCLFSLNETGLREPLRSGATNDDLAQIICDAVWRKELKHRIGDPGFIQPARTMSAIGG